MTALHSSSTTVVVVGGGVIGLSCAWRLARRGVAVTVVDPSPGTVRPGPPPGCWPR